MVSSSVTELLVIVRVLPLLRLNAGLRTSHVLAKDRTGLTFICFKASGRLITSRCSGNEPALLLRTFSREARTASEKQRNRS